MATFEKRTSKDGQVSYRVKIRLKGFPVQSASFERLTDARKWAASTESAIREGRHFKTNVSKKYTLSDAIARFKSDVLPVKYKNKERLNRKSILEWWDREIGFVVLADLNAALFADCRDELAKTPSRKGGCLKPDTIKKYFDTMKSVLKCCVNDWALIERSPLMDGRVEMPPLPRGRVRFLDDDERERLLTACKESSNEWLYTVVVLALSSGMRKSEVLNLYWRLPRNPPLQGAWGVVNLDERNITLHQTKNQDRRRLPLVGLAYDLLKQHAKIRRLDTDLVFPSAKNPHKPIDLTRPWENARDAAKLEDFRFHDLRHTTASYLAMNGASLAEISEITGHRDLKMLKRYLHLTQSHIDGVVSSMNQKIFGGW